MDIKQLKLNGVPFYPKVGVDSIVNADGTASAVDTVVTQGSQNLVTSDAVYDAVNDIEHTPHWSDIQDKPNFATVATSGDYDDLLNKPTIPSQIVVDAQLDANSENPVQNKVINGYVVGLTNSVAAKAAAVKVGDDRYDSTDGVVSLPAYPSVKKFACDDANKCDISGTGDVTFSGDGIVNTAHPAPNVLAISLSNQFVTAVEGKQDALVSGTNIKTINNQSLLGSGNIDIQEGSTITVDSQLSNTSENPVQNKVIANEISSISGSLTTTQSNVQSLSSTVSGMSTDITNLQTASANHSSAISALDGSVSNISSNVSTMSGQIATLNNTVAGVLDDVDTAVDKIELVDHAVDGVTQKTVQYTTIGGLTPTTLFDIDYKVKKGSYNPVASQAVYAAIDDTFKDLSTQYSKGIYLTEVLNKISHVETVAGSNIQATFDMSGQISWFNACGDSGQTDRLVKKQYLFSYVPVTTETTQWGTTVWGNAQVWVDEINNRNNTDFVINGAPLLELNEVSSGKYEISIDIKLVSAKYQVVSIDNLVFYYNGTQLSQAAPAVQSIDRTYTYPQSRDGIYIDSINNEIVACINSMWYKIADLETSPIKPLG